MGQLKINCESDSPPQHPPPTAPLPPIAIDKARNATSLGVSSESARVCLFLLQVISQQAMVQPF